MILHLMPGRVELGQALAEQSVRGNNENKKEWFHFVGTVLILSSICYKFKVLSGVNES